MHVHAQVHYNCNLTRNEILRILGECAAYLLLAEVPLCREMCPLVGCVGGACYVTVLVNKAAVLTCVWWAEV